MSRTIHHRNQHTRHFGKDFGAKYKCDKHYGVGTGPNAKNKADSERRNDSKNLINQFKKYGDSND